MRIANSRREWWTDGDTGKAMPTLHVRRKAGGFLHIRKGLTPVSFWSTDDQEAMLRITTGEPRPTRNMRADR